jgi:hypothetical protein
MMIMRMILSKNPLKRKIKSCKKLRIKKIQNLIKSLLPKNQRSRKRKKRMIKKRLKKKKKKKIRRMIRK